jgi:hypothetical protein
MVVQSAACSAHPTAQGARPQGPPAPLGGWRRLRRGGRQKCVTVGRQLGFRSTLCEETSLSQPGSQLSFQPPTLRDVKLVDSTRAEKRLLLHQPPLVPVLQRQQRGVRRVQRAVFAVVDQHPGQGGGAGVDDVEPGARVILERCGLAHPARGSHDGGASQVGTWQPSSRPAGRRARQQADLTLACCRSRSRRCSWRRCGWHPQS